jgi:hypothetical protein
MKRIIVLLFALAASSVSVFCGDRHIAFECGQAVWMANVDGTGEKKIADAPPAKSKIRSIECRLMGRI